MRYSVPFSASDLLQQLPNSRFELAVLAGVGLADRARYRNVHAPRIQLHRLAVVGGDARAGHANRRAVNECGAAGKDDPAGRGLAHHLAELELAIPLRE